MTNEPILYCITNSVNEKLYIGKTTQKLNKRWSGHKHRAKIGLSTYFYNAIRKHGVDSFTIKPIATSKSYETITWLEKALIAELNTSIPGILYNTKEGGDGALHSEETKRKISEVQTGKRPSEYYKNMGAKYSSDARRITATKLWSDPVFRANRSGDNHWTRRLGYNPETIKKMAEGKRKAHEQRYSSSGS